MVRTGAGPGISERLRGVSGDFFRRGRWGSLPENLMIVVLAFYPLRHIGLGLDLWDTGYNYGNFQYMGTRQTGEMWFFATYLSNAAGNLLTKLPHGDTLTGMNLYTGLFVSVLALAGYFFCTRKLKIGKGIAFVGEMAAISLCWCPTALLYNYLTYVLFLASCIFLYLGLTRENRASCVSAGALLGANVLVRFPNLSEIAMIAAVWAYDFIVWREGRQQTGKLTALSAGMTGVSGGRTAASEKETGVSGFWRRTVRHTLWCVSGYAAALGVLFLFLHFRYGIMEYADGIRKLFGMTEQAGGYKPASMFLGMVRQYADSLYWVARMGMIAACGMVLFVAAGWADDRLGRKGGSARGGMAGYIPAAVRCLWAGVSIAMAGWLYWRHFCSLLFYSYDSIWQPGRVFLVLAMVIAAVRIFCRGSSREEKLAGGMVVLVLLLTPLGSNNGVLPALNNLFLAAPYTLWESWRFLRYAGDRKSKSGILVSLFPVKGILAAFLALCLFQFGGFGVTFAFAEGTGIRNAEVVSENNPVLENIRMSPEKARWMAELGAYVEENNLRGREVVLYGMIPSLSYYLHMPAALNPWSDLDSYRCVILREDVEELKRQVAAGAAEKPVVILENVYALYAEGGRSALEEAGIQDAVIQRVEEDPKWQLWMDFLESLGYGQTFRNERFAVYR